MPFLEQSFGLITAALNSQVNGQYLFAGARTDQPPITVNNLAELEMLPTSADAFGNDQMKKQAIVAEGVQVEFGILADEVADEIMASMKRLAELNAVSSLDGTLKDGDPLALPPIPDQREFLIAELEKIESAVQKAQSAQINNALVGNRLDSIDEQHATAQIFLEGLVSDIEDVDLAEAITRLNQDQTALAASFQVLGSLSRLSLLNFL
jgi:flagellar hook-associated protein 3 FlgL